MLKQSRSIAVTALALLGIAGCERNKSADETVRERDESVEGARTDGPAGERLDADSQRRLDTAQERFDKLERRAADAKRDLEARSGQVRTDLDRNVANAKAKLEAARKASAANARRAIEELDEALNNLDRRLGEYDRT